MNHIRAVVLFVACVAGMAVVAVGASAAPPAGTELTVTPVAGTQPPGDAVPQAAAAAGTGDGSSVVYFAGNEVETWTFATASSSWTKQSPSTGPTERQGAAAGTLAGTSTRTLLYGGYVEPTTYFSETWMFDTATGEWTKRCEPCAPGALARSMMAASPTETLLVMGSTEFGFNQDVWRWDDAASDWTQIIPSGPNGFPPGRGDAQLAYDGTNFVLYGGLNGSFVSMDDAWLLIHDGGDAWHWEEVCTGCPPGKRSLGAFGHLGGAGTPSGALLFGGANIDSHTPGNAPAYSDGWFLDANDHTWTQVIAGVPPTPVPDDPNVPYGPTLASFSGGGGPYQLLLTATRFDDQGTERTDANVLAWQAPPPPTTTTTAPTTTTTTTGGGTVQPVIVTPSYTG